MTKRPDTTGAGKSASPMEARMRDRAMTDTSKPNGDRDRDRKDLGLRYYVLPDDPLAALNILREAAGLEPWPAQGTEPK